MASDRLPAAVVQSQRDLFGAHTYKRSRSVCVPRVSAPGATSNRSTPSGQSPPRYYGCVWPCPRSRSQRGGVWRLPGTLGNGMLHP
ncbi:MAG TPA: hypothetical protein VIJ07_05670 [Dermatophilaceae bacterium]